MVSNFLEASECERIIEAKKREGYRCANTHYPTYYRNNERSISDKAELADELFQKVKDFVPRTIHSDGAIASENGTWQLQGINERIRFCRYMPGQFFGKHLDGVHYRSKTVQSKLTFMVYLNDCSEFEGGRTLFYSCKDSEVPIQEYHPKCGDLMVFDHNLWHEGETVTAGEKYILRSDILYKRTDNVLVDTKERFPNEHLGYIWKLLELNDGRIVSSGRDKTVRVWNKQGKVEQELSGHANSVLAMAQLTDGTLVTGSRDSAIRIWNQRKNGSFGLGRIIQLPTSTVLDVLALENGGFASAASDGVIRLFNFSGDELLSKKAHTDWIWQLQQLDDDKLVSVSQDGTIKVWSNDLQLVTSSRINGGGLTAIVRIGKCIFAGDAKGRMHEWIWECGQLHYQIGWQAHAGLIRSVVEGEHGTVITGSEDNQAKVWSIGQHKMLKSFAHENFVQSLLYRKAEGILLSSAYDGEIREWVGINELANVRELELVEV